MDKNSYCSLRAGRELKPRMVITVEPGVYFIESLLLPAFENPELNQFLNVDRIKQFMKFGGVRIEVHGGYGVFVM